MAKQSLLRDPSVVGTYIKMGSQWLKIEDMTKATLIEDSNGKRLEVKRTGKEIYIYQGFAVDKIKKSLKDKGVPE